MNLLSAIPFPYRLLALALLAAALVVFGWAKGAGNVQAEWDAATVKQSLAVADIKTKQAEATVKVVTEYVDRVQIIRRAGETIIKEVTKYVPSDTCTLPAGFRLLHDTAAAGNDPDPAGIADAQPVPAQTLAETIAENYTACRLNAEQLNALQSWAAGQSEISEGVQK